MANSNYRTLQDELDKILEELQTGEVDIDKSLVLYKQGQKLVSQLQKQLETAKNTIKTISKEN